MSDVIVSKFGSAAFSTPDMIKKTAQIVMSQPERKYVIVSAPGAVSREDMKVTDMLFIMNARYTNRENFDEMMTQIRDRFSDIARGIGVNAYIDAEIMNLKKNLFFGRGNDYVVSRGEYIMAKIFAEYIGWKFIDAADFIFFGRDGALDREKTFEAATKIFAETEHAVIPGFYGSAGTNAIKLFPRGGADITAAIVARAVNATLCEKWSETTKIYSADPGIVDNPEVIRQITYEELKQLTYMGINIFHEDVILLMQDIGIPLRVRNINDIDDEGTSVTADLPEDSRRGVAACIAGKRNYRIIHIQKFGLNRLTGIGQKVFGIFTERNISCEHYMSGIYRFSIVVKNPLFDLKRAEILQALKDAIKPENITVEKNLSLITVVGKGMGTVKGIFAKIFNAIAAAGIKVRMIEQGSDDLNIIIGVYDEDYEAAVRALYGAVILK
ncbi:MAG: ACT domain-containing protein [Synergistaceae bacterium]|nr:ACT domain-containing protein [Synergistaceae bacterium]